MKQLQRFVAYSPNAGPLPPIPTPTEWGFSIPLNDVSGATMSYRDGTVGADVLKQTIEIAAEYSLNNGLTWAEYPNGRYLRLGRSGNETDPNGVRSYTLPGYGWLLNRMRQMKTTGLNADGKRAFNSSNVGMILKTLIDEAQARGVCTGLSYDFTPSLDSAAVAWNKVVSIAYEPGLDLFTILNNLSQQGICDWYFQGRTLRIFNADSYLAAATNVKMKFPTDIKGLPVQGSYEEFIHSVLVLGDGGKRLSLSADPSVPTPWGKWEGFIGQGGVSDTGTMTILGQAALDNGNHEKRQYTAEINLPTTNYEPIVDYTQGSFIKIPTEDGDQSFRLRQLNFSRNGSGDPSLGLVINDRFLEKEIRNARRVNGITGGATTGGAGTAPTKEPGARRPAKALGLVVDSAVTIEPGGNPQAWALFSYPEVSTDKDGVALEISSYKFRARQPVFNLLTENPSFESAYTGGAGGSATVAVSTAWFSDGAQSIRVTPNGVNSDSSAYPVGGGDALGGSMVKMGVVPGKTYVISADVYVNAVQTGSVYTHARKIVVGRRATGGTVSSAYAVSTQAPNKVGKTTIALKFSVPASNTEDMFFRLVNGSPNAAETVNWDNVQILEYSTSPWGAWGDWGSSTSLNHSYGPLAPGKTWQVQFAAVSETGVPGDWSDTVQFNLDVDITPPPTPSTPGLSTRLGTITVTWDGKDSGGLAMPQEAPIVHVYRQLVGSGTTVEVGVLDRRAVRVSLVMADVVIGEQYEFWLVSEDTSGNLGTASAHALITVASIMDDPEAALDIQDNVSVGSKNTYSASTPSGSGVQTNDKWFQLSGGVTVGVWYWDGDSWEPETLSNATIANLDAGKITTGTLAAARIAAGAITVDKLAVGAVDATKLTADAIDGKTITGVFVKGGMVASGTRTAYNDFNDGIFLKEDGIMSIRGASTPDVAGGHLILVSPQSNYFRIGTAGTGNGGWTQIEGTGRIRTYLNSNNAVFLDINPGAASQNMKVGGALFANSLNLGDAMAGTIYGLVTATSTSTDVSANGSNRSVSLLPSGSGHIYLLCGTGQVRSMTIAGDVLTAAATTGVYIRTDTGQMGISASSQRFKVAIEKYSFKGRILDLEPKTWYDKRETEKYAEALHQIGKGAEEEEALKDLHKPLAPGYGFVAEEVQEAGLEEFVLRNKEGDIIALAYDRLWIPLVPEVRALRERIERLESEWNNKK